MFYLMNIKQHMDLIKACIRFIGWSSNEQSMDLIKACISKDTEKALGLIMNNNINLGIFDANGKTALIVACCHKMKKVALELIKTGKSNPDHIDNFGKTALIWACNKKNERSSIGTN